MGLPYRGARVVVTGASSGIGADLAEAFARRGSHVALVARRAERLDVVAQRCSRHGVDAHALPADVGDLDAAAAAGGAALDRLGGVDVLVNNAGIPRRVHAARLTFAQVEETMRVNYLGAMAVTWALLPHLLAAGRGHVVNVGSIAGRIPAPREAAYAASKAALTMMSEVLATDLRGSGVRVHLVTPAVIDTPLWEVEGQEPSPFRGTPTSTAEVTAAVFRLLDSGRFEAFVPRRFRLVPLIKAALGGRFLESTASYDRKHVPAG